MIHWFIHFSTSWFRDLSHSLRYFFSIEYNRASSKNAILSFKAIKRFHECVFIFSIKVAFLDEIVAWIYLIIFLKEVYCFSNLIWFCLCFKFNILYWMYVLFVIWTDMTESMNFVKYENFFDKNESIKIHVCDVIANIRTYEIHVSQFWNLKRIIFLSVIMM